MNAQIRLIESPFTATDKRQKTKRKGRKRMAERRKLKAVSVKSLMYKRL